MTSRVIATIVISIVLVASIGIAIRFLPMRSKSRLFAPILVTAVSAELVLTSYLWMFKTNGCIGGRGNVACVLNANVGVLTLIAVVLAGGAVWAGLLAEQRRRRDERNDLRKKALTALGAALEETHHNLVHVGMNSSSAGHFQRLPQLSVDALEEATRPEFREMFPSRRIGHWLNTLLRNHRRILLELNQSQKGVEDDSEIQFVMAAYVKSAVLLLFVAQANSASRQHMTSDATNRVMTRILGLARQVQNAGHQARIENCIRYVHVSSLAEGEISALTASDIPVVCWVEDSVLTGVRTFPLRDNFRSYVKPVAGGGTRTKP